jgi:hypothetical protein
MQKKNTHPANDLMKMRARFNSRFDQGIQSLDDKL